MKIIFTTEEISTLTISVTKSPIKKTLLENKEAIEGYIKQAMMQAKENNSKFNFVEFQKLLSIKVGQILDRPPFNKDAKNPTYIVTKKHIEDVFGTEIFGIKNQKISTVKNKPKIDAKRKAVLAARNERYLLLLKAVYFKTFEERNFSNEETEERWKTDSSRYKTVGKNLIKHLVNIIRDSKKMLKLEQSQPENVDYSNAKPVPTLDVSSLNFNSVSEDSIPRYSPRFTDNKEIADWRNTLE